MKRILDVFGSLLGIIFLSPVFLLVFFWIKWDDGGKVFFVQSRVGQDNRDFKMFKFRSMKAGSDKKGLLTVGSADARITGPGRFLRKYKIDELPQLFNVLIGDMSLVGPRPEVRKYVDLYTAEQFRVLAVKPGITDPVSLHYFEESDLLAKSNNPEKTYIEEIMPKKLLLALEYAQKSNVFLDIKIILLTIKRIILN
jgi:lipopolysaccharide/colanic/teichoic acid biosynthesis glycosyltransferase